MEANEKSTILNFENQDMECTRFNAYRNMWIMVLFDLPTDTRKERAIATQFRKDLLRDGFQMFQYSIYIRFAQSQENADVHIGRVKKLLPVKGHIGIFCITDRQFGRMEIFHGVKKQPGKDNPQQLLLF
jgi:CRISPR-associated protein Cas2